MVEPEAERAVETDREDAKHQAGIFDPGMEAERHGFRCGREKDRCERRAPVEARLAARPKALSLLSANGGRGAKGRNARRLVLRCSVPFMTAVDKAGNQVKSDRSHVVL